MTWVDMKLDLLKTQKKFLWEMGVADLKPLLK